MHHLLLLLPLLAPADEPVLTLPDGPAAKAWAGVGAETVPAGAPRGAATAEWSEPETWRRWAELVAAAAAGERPDPARRAELCLLARAHGRARDAWRHYRALGGDPAWVAAVTPALLPGAPPGAAVEPGGRPAPLPDGARLEPFLPPTSQAGPAGAVAWRTATVHGLRVGDAVVDLAVTVEATGVQVDVTHVSGGSATLEIVLPEPEGFEIRVEYVDWLRRDPIELRDPIPLAIGPGEEPRQLYGRVIERRSELPTGLPERLPEGLRRGGLTFVVPADDPDREELGRVAETVGELLGIPTRLRAHRVPGEGWTGTTFELGPAGAERAERLRFLASSIERFLLGR